MTHMHAYMHTLNKQPNKIVGKKTCIILQEEHRDDQ